MSPLERPISVELRRSVLDRLLEGTPTTREKRIRDRARIWPAGANEPEIVGLIAAGVLEDLERLLSTARVDECAGLAPGDPIGQSAAAYGLPDRVRGSALEPGGSGALANAIREAIGRFEPRLADLVVTVEPGAADGSIPVRIKARLVLDHAADHSIALEAVVRPSAAAVEVGRRTDGPGPDRPLSP